jgi:hypothetical protein
MHENVYLGFTDLLLGAPKYVVPNRMVGHLVVDE